MENGAGKKRGAGAVRKAQRPAISTKLQVEALKPEAKEYAVRDAKTEGLWLVVKPSGTKTWVYFYRFKGPQKKLTLGPMGLAEARKKAAEARILIVEGMDPAAAKRSYKAAQAALPARRHEPPLIEADAIHIAGRPLLAEGQGEIAEGREAPAGETLGDLIETVVKRFVAEYAKPRRRAWKETERLLQRHVVAALRSRRLSEIAQHEFVELLDRLADHAPVTANRLHSALSIMCKWASGQTKRGATPGERRVKLLGSNPFAGVGKAIEENPARERVLSDAELRLVWKASDNLGFPFGPIIKILALTGQRRSEVAGLRWDEIDLDRAAEWTLPPERTKNGRAHVVPLVPEFVAILESLPRFSRDKGQLDHVFSSGDTAPSGFSKAKLRLDKKILELQRKDDPEAEALPQWQFHDLRRTCVTGLSMLRVPPHVREAVVNHVSGHRAGVAGVYDRWEYLEEKREALAAWATYVEKLTAPAEPEALGREHAEA